MGDPISSTECPLDDIFFLSDFSEECSSTAIDVPEAIEEMAELGLPSDTFHCEEEGLRLASFATCSPGQIQLFAVTQESISNRIGMMSTEEIADNLSRLYDRAYRYDPATKAMDVYNRQAKGELDLWIAAIDCRAFQDEAFLNRIMEVRESDVSQPERSEASREIEIVMALNSPNLSPNDRGTFYRLRNDLATWAEVSEEGNRLTLEWMRQDEGRSIWIDTPFWRSGNEFQTAITAWLGREDVQRILHENYSEERVREMARDLGMVREFESLMSLSDEALTLRLQDISDLTFQRPAPELMRRLNRELMLGLYVLNGRDGDHESRFRENYVQNLMAVGGFSRQDAEILLGPADAAAPLYTASRLDDYRRRFELLGEFREMYREFLSTPLAERFAPERMARFNLWGQLILNGGRMIGAPITIGDINRVRREIQAEVGVQTSGPTTWDDFICRDVHEPLFVRPDELGGMTLAADSCAEPFSVSSRMTVDGRPLSDIVRENADFVAILPPELVPADHAAGLAYGLFGVVILNGGEWRWDSDPSPGYFHEVLAHEVAGHEVWARTQFNDHPERLAWLGPDERNAYIIGMGALDAYQETGCIQAGERGMLSSRYVFVDGIVRVANRRLELDADDRLPRFDARQWEGRPPEFFMFQPGYLVGPDGCELPDLVQQVRALPRSDRQGRLSSLVQGAAYSLHLDRPERRLLDQTIEDLHALGSDRISPTFLPDHPLARVINFVSGKMGGMTTSDHMTFTRRAWDQVVTNLIVTDVAVMMRNRQLGEQEAHDWNDLLNLRNLHNDFWAGEAENLSLDDELFLFEALDQLDHVTTERPVDLFLPHPLVRILNRAMEEDGMTPVDELNVKDSAEWRRIEVFLLRRYSATADPVCRMPASLSTRT